MDAALIQYVAKTLYPDLFKDLDPTATYLKFYEQYLPIRPAMALSCWVRTTVSHQHYSVLSQCAEQNIQSWPDVNSVIEEKARNLSFFCGLSCA